MTYNIVGVNNTVKENNLTIGISLNPELVKKIDQQRGLIPRSRFIAKLLSDGLE